MSNDMLGPVTRALTHVSQGRLSICTQVANCLASPDGGIWHELFAELLRKGLPANIGHGNALEVIARVRFKRAEGKKTEHCFSQLHSQQFSYRAGTFDGDFEDGQPTMESEHFQIFELRQELSLKEIVQRMLGVTADETFLAKKMVEFRHVVTLPVIQDYVEQPPNKWRSAWLDVPLGTELCFFSRNKRNLASVVKLTCHQDGKWQAYTNEVRHGSQTFKRRTRFFVRA